MSTDNVLERIASIGVVPVIAIENADDAVPLVDALTAGGVAIAEVTFRTAAARDAIAAIARERPAVLVGAGTVLDAANLEAAAEAGAQFVVAPGLNPKLVHRANELGLPMTPGVCTPSEVERGLEQGCRILKFYPAGVCGGTAMLKALAGPYKHTGVRFVPTGGVSEENLASYIALPVVAAVGGSWLATKDDIAAKRWDAITERCRVAVRIIEDARTS